MSMAAMMTNAAETGALPDALLRFGIQRLVGYRRRALRGVDAGAADFAREMQVRPIAQHAEAANRQHYELPAAFFGHILGPARKYSCCLYPTGREPLAEAEQHALEETVAHARLRDGQAILELGCGWGSLTLFMARRFPNAGIVAVSNSTPQRQYIEAEAKRLGIGNIRVVTADMNFFAPDRDFDRVVSVEMFEHMANWRALLSRIRAWLKPDGLLFLHVFAHENQPYRFDHEDEADWIAQNFFTGGIMPSHGLIGAFPDLFTLLQDWRWPGTHYAQTARDWLHNFDANLPAIRPLLAEVYGSGAKRWEQRWRLFFLATEGLFGHAGGLPWGVSHYLLAPAA